MMKKIIFSCLTFLFCFTFQDVFAASTCDYSEQVELNSIASTINTKYSIERKLVNNDGTVEENLNVDDVTVDMDSPYSIEEIATFSIYNLTNDVYVTISSNRDFYKTYHYEDTNNGEITILAGDVSEIQHYRIEVFSNKAACLGESLRVIEEVIPMKNDYSAYEICGAIPSYTYCQEYIKAPFLASDSEIMEGIRKEYEKQQQEKEEENENTSFIEKVKDFIEKNKIAIYSIIGIIIVFGVVITIVILKKKRSRIL